MPTTTATGISRSCNTANAAQPAQSPVIDTKPHNRHNFHVESNNRCVDGIPYAAASSSSTPAVARLRALTRTLLEDAIVARVGGVV